MHAIDLPRTLQLKHEECIAARGAAVRLTVVAGCLWFTRPGDLRDHFLQAGEQCVLRDEGALASAEGPTRVHVEAAGRSRIAALAWRWWHRIERAAPAPAATVTGGIIDRCPSAATS